MAKKGSAAMSVPNQRMVIIHRETPKSDFLGIKNENWKAALRDLKATAFQIYIYLASNCDGYRLELSPQAILNEIGVPKATTHDQIKKLIEKGYLVKYNDNTYDFYETPKKPESHNEVVAEPTKTANEVKLWEFE